MTLLELIVAVALMGIAFAAVLGGMAVFLHSESVQRTHARLDTDLRTYAERLLDAPYRECAQPSDYTVTEPSGYDASFSVAYWDGSLPAAFASTCGGDRGMQRLTVVLVATDGTTGTLVVGKSR